MKPIAPGSTIGIIGGGQLGRMLAIAATEMGYHVHVYCPEKEAPAVEVAKFDSHGAYTDDYALARFGASVDVVTYEFENIPVEPIAELAKHALVRPGPDILGIAQHRVLEKQTINHLGIATAPWQAVTSVEEVIAAKEALGLPAVLKTSRMGYDGKGQVKLTPASDVRAAWNTLGTTDAIFELFVHFKMEISVIVARDVQGNIACYTPVQNIHTHHILSETIAPAPIPPELAKQAEVIATTIATGLDLIGLMAVEMFVTNTGELLVNEIAPRPHNSGHWTIDACVTNQFEQTIRAICGLPLGSPQHLCAARMRNLIGDDVNEWQRYISSPYAKLHLYGKNETRPGRKMGHVTLLSTLPE